MVYNIAVLDEAIHLNDNYFILDEIREICSKIITDPKLNDDTFNNYINFLDKTDNYDEFNSYDVISSNVIRPFFNLCHESNIMLAVKNKYDDPKTQMDLAQDIHTPGYILKLLFLQNYKQQNEICKSIVSNRNAPLSVLIKACSLNDTELKLNILFNDNTDYTILQKLSSDTNKMISLWSSEKLNNSMPAVSDNKNSALDYYCDQIINECYMESPNGNRIFWKKELTEKYDIDPDDIENLYKSMLYNDNTVDVQYDGDELDIIVGWKKCRDYQPLNEDEEIFLEYKNIYMEMIEKRFQPYLWNLNTETVLIINDRLLNREVATFNCYNEKHAFLLYDDFILDKTSDLVDYILETEETEYIYDKREIEDISL